MLSGGSVASWSVTFAAKTVTVQVSEPAKSLSGSSVNVVGPPLAAAVWLPLELHEIENQLPVTFTGSLNVIVTLLFRATPPAPSAGFVLETVGAASPLFRGFGVPTVKSALLLSVSTLPPPFRRAAVVLLSVAVGSVSEQFVPLPYPTMSTAPSGQTVPLAIVVLLLISTTLPAPAAIAMLPVASGGGRFTVPPAPAASWTR